MLLGGRLHYYIVVVRANTLQSARSNYFGNSIRDFAHPLVGEPHRYNNNTTVINSNLYGTPI